MRLLLLIQDKIMVSSTFSLLMSHTQVVCPTPFPSNFMKSLSPGFNKIVLISNSTAIQLTTCMY